VWKDLLAGWLAFDSCLKRQMSSRRRSKRDAAADNSSDDEDETLLLKGAHADVAFWYKHAEKVGLNFVIFHIVHFFAD
jgi:hypothetical protein